MSELTKEENLVIIDVQVPKGMESFIKEYNNSIKELQRQIDILNNKVKYLEDITCAR